MKITSESVENLRPPLSTEFNKFYYSGNSCCKSFRLIFLTRSCHSIMLKKTENQTLKILSCSHRKIFKVFLKYAIFQH